MAYLGNAPARSFISFERQVFTIVNSQTAYTLSHSVTNENDIRLVVNNVVQEPGSGKAYTATGTTLTLSAALTNGTDEMYCVFLGRAVGTVNAPAGSVGTSQLAADAVTNAKVDSSVITGQTAEATVADDDLVLLSDTSASAALKKMTVANLTANAGVAGISSSADATAISIDSSEVVRLPVGVLRLQNSTTGTADTDGLLIEASGNDVYINNKENADMYFRTNNKNSLKIHHDGELDVNVDNSGSSVRAFHVRPYGSTADLYDGFQIGTDSARSYIQTFRQTTSTSTHHIISNTNGAIGSITTNGTSTSFNTSSDHRLKENVNYDFDATSRLKQLKPARFNFIKDADKTLDGFLAHEVQSIVPESVHGTHNETETKQKVVINSDNLVIAENVEQTDWETGKIADDNGNTKYPTDSTWEATKVVPVYQGIDQAKLVPLLVKTITELEARITELVNE